MMGREGHAMNLGDAARVWTGAVLLATAWAGACGGSKQHSPMSAAASATARDSAVDPGVGDAGALDDAGTCAPPERAAAACGGDAGMSEPRAANPGQAAVRQEMPDPCRGRDTPLGFGEQSRFGGTAQDLFAGLAGECTAGLSWDARELAGRVQPAKFATELTLKLALAEDTVVQSTERALPSGVACPDELRVEADVELSTAGGELAAMAHTTVRHVAGLGVQPLRLFMEDLERVPRFDVGPQEAGFFEVVLNGGDPKTCAGEVLAQVYRALPDGSREATSVSIAAWSASGCPLGETVYDMDSERGQALLAALDQAWGDASLAGTWDDGGRAVLSLRATFTGAVVCQDGAGGLQIPVLVRYATDDGRVMAHELEQDVSAFPDDPEQPLLLVLHDYQACAQTDSELPFAAADCAQVQSVTAQLSLATARQDELGGRELGLYAVGRDGNPLRLDGLALEPGGGD